MKRPNFESLKLLRNMNNSFPSSITVNQYFDVVGFFSRSAFHALKSVCPACNLNASFANVNRLCLIVGEGRGGARGGESNCKFLEKNPQVHLTIIRK